MATVSSIAQSGNIYIDALLYGNPNGVYWTDGPVSYSFPNAFSVYGSYSHTISGFAQVSFEQRTAVRSILGDATAALGPNGFTYGSVDSFTNLSFTDLNNFALSGDLDIAQTNLFDGANLDTAKVADFPRLDQRSDSGDVWFGDDYAGTINDYRDPTIGNYAWLTTIHELGHALGLKHAHNLGGGTVVMPTARDAMEFTVMSYRSYVGGPSTGGYTNEEFGYAQTYMMEDIRALQYLYGADFTTNSTNTVYSWNPTTGEMSINGVGQGAPGANRVFLTIWDGNGTDTYDMSNYSNAVLINLTPGGWSTTSTTQRANLGNGNFAQGNVYNAYQYNGDARSLIENATGGSNNDLLFGNQANNILIGGPGGDTAYGYDGNDTFRFNVGDIQFGSEYVNGGTGTDDKVQVSGAGLFDFRGSTILNIEEIEFNADGANVDKTVRFDSSQFYSGGISPNVLIDGNSSTGSSDAITIFMTTAISFSMAGWTFQDWGGQDERIVVFGDASAEVITGSSQLDIIQGGAGSDILSGGAGNDNLNGGADNDNLNGGADNDTLYGDANDDVLTGGSGADTQTGGTGADWFNYVTPAEFGDTIVDFSNFEGDKFTLGGSTRTLIDAHVDFVLGLAPRSGMATLMVNGNELWWDQDGNGAGAAVKIADVFGLGTGHADIAGLGTAGWSEVATGDFNNDGRTDILWKNDASGATAAWLMGANGAPASTPFYFSLAGWDLVASGDFGGDPATDLMWRNDAGQTAIWQMAGGNVASNYFTYGSPGWTPLGQGDFNNDGFTDVLWRQDATGSTASWLMAGGAPASTPIYLSAAGWNLAAIADVNGDGTSDLIWQQGSQIAEWLMQPGSGTVGTATFLGDAGSWSLIGSGDFNADGTDDLLWKNTDGTVASWLMAGGAIGASPFYQSAAGWDLVATGDFNHDGTTDLFWRNASGNTALWLMEPGSGTLAVGTISDPVGGAHVIATGDFNGDTVDDILWGAAGTTVDWQFSHLNPGDFLFA